MNASLNDPLETSSLATQTRVPTPIPVLAPTPIIYSDWFTEGRIHFESHFKGVIAKIANRPGVGALVPAAVNPGRRIRPTLYCALWKASQGNYPEGADLLPALALELFHAASIVLDDIADGEESRRDKQPFFRIYDVDTAMLVSHLLMAEGGRLLGSHWNSSKLLQVWTNSYLTAAEGQAFTIRRFEGFTLEEHYTRSLAKTSSFFTFISEALQSCTLVTVPGLTGSLREVGECFQISNDVIDLLFLEQTYRHNADRSYPLRPSGILIQLIEAGIVDEREVFTVVHFSRHRELAEAAKFLIPKPESFLRKRFQPVQDRLLQEPLSIGHKTILSDFLDCATSPSFWLHFHG